MEGASFEELCSSMGALIKEGHPEYGFSLSAKR